MSEHTPTPWKVVTGETGLEHHLRVTARVIVDAEHRHVASVFPANGDREANARFVVTAVNAHAALLAAAERVVRTHGMLGQEHMRALDDLSAAIAKAREMNAPASPVEGAS